MRIKASIYTVKYAYTPLVGVADGLVGTLEGVVVGGLL